MTKRTRSIVSKARFRRCESCKNEAEPGYYRGERCCTSCRIRYLAYFIVCSVEEKWQDAHTYIREISLPTMVPSDRTYPIKSEYCEYGDGQPISIHRNPMMLDIGLRRMNWSGND